MNSLKYRIFAGLGVMVFILITKSRHNSFEDNLPFILVMLGGITIGALIYFSAYKLFLKIIKALFPKKITHTTTRAKSIYDVDEVEEDKEKYREMKNRNNNIVDRINVKNKSAKSVVTRNW
ncbi:MAG: hypothetical protein L3J51_01170 [Cocleimonas sp.]|nr:hypothetical protein [Cocleimonas sp.]